ncbi:quinone oxidoreductase family protein [Nonomuraea sp. KM88]|uniref:quinone oxidoreductase family protein n=1 Tax=Nonomuraea sp. KM88 TaxID=3457427 RepID=UPI003FCC5648
MKAIRMHAVGGPEVLRLDDVDVPSPGPNQVLVKVAAAGIAYGDVMKRQGGFGQELPLPAGLGLQVAGTVAALGREVSAPEPGSRVMAWVDHGYAEYALAAAPAVVPLPDTVDFQSAATLPVQGVTAYQTLHDAGRLRQGESVLVHAGAGGVGSIAVQLARLLGAAVVIGTASRQGKLDHIRALGAIAVDYTGDDWPSQILEATRGRGVDLVLDSIGGSVAARSLECLAPFGRMVSFGVVGGSPADVSSMSLMHGNLSFIGYGLPGQMQRQDRVAAAVGELLDMLAAGRLKVAVGQAFPLERADQAHRAIGERSTTGMTVLLP